MTIIHDTTQQQFLFINEDQHIVGRLAYRMMNETRLDAYSTKVLPEFEGKGIANALYNALIGFVQQNGFKVKPSCHYIDVKMTRHHSELIG